MRTVLVWVLAVLTIAASPHPARADSPASDIASMIPSVVRIVNYSQRGDWSSPWSATQVVESSGSGFVIDGGLVMTNAHVISDSRFLLVQAHNDPQPHEAEVVFVAHDCDLAVIRPVDPEVLAGVPALEFGDEHPELGSTVDTLGYPVGGIKVSSTRGVVSRIEQQFFMHSGKDVHIAGQTDAAINPGNSGGPVVQDGRVVGVAFQGNLDLENVGYFIADDVIDRFLADIEDGRYDGYPELGVQLSSLENPAALARAGLDGEATGVVVDDVDAGSSAEGILRPRDIILTFDGRPVAGDGSVADRDSRAPIGMLVDRLQIGESVRLEVLRDGRRVELEVVLEGFTPGDRHGNAYDRLPRYFVYAGLVFVPLEVEVLKTYGLDWLSDAPKELLHEFVIRPSFDKELILQERVVLLRRLNHPVNVDMAWHRNQVVERVNGRSIVGLDDLIEAVEGHRGDQHLIEFSTGHRFGVLDRERAEAANAEILQRYGIEKDRNL